MKKQVSTTYNFYGHIQGNIWMPPVLLCTKEFDITFEKMPKSQTSGTSLQINNLRDALLHITNDGDFQNAVIGEINGEIKRRVYINGVYHKSYSRFINLKRDGINSDVFAPVNEIEYPSFDDENF